MVFSPREGRIDYLTFLVITVSLFIGAIGTDEWEYTNPSYLAVVWFGALCIGYYLFMLTIGGAMASIYYSVKMGGMPLVQAPTIIALSGLVFTFVGWTVQYYAIGFDKIVSNARRPTDSAAGPAIFTVHVASLVLLFCAGVIYWRHIVSSHAKMVADQIARGFDPGVTPLLNKRNAPPPVEAHRRW